MPLHNVLLVCLHCLVVRFKSCVATGYIQHTGWMFMYLYRPSTLRHMLRIQRCAVHITSFMQTAVDYIYRATSSLRSNNTYTVSSTKFLCLQFGTWNNARDPVCN